MIFPVSRLNTFIKNGGLNSGIFSVWGAFGVGKTTFALQTALKSAKVGSKVIYLYTKLNLPFPKIRNLFKNNIESLDKFIVIQPIDFDDLTKIIFNLEFLILTNDNEKEDSYKLIVIDSLTDLYRIGLNRERKAINYDLNYQLNQILANLSYLNKSYSLDVLIVNETTKRRTNDHFIEKQSGGKVMEYWISTNFKIERTNKNNTRNIFLEERFENKRIQFESTLTESGFF